LACGAAPDLADFRVGMDRASVRAEFGAPSQVQEIVKTEEAIFGPIEEFWDSVDPGSTVEIWHYGVQGGTVELYFVDGSDAVQGVGFAPEGAVY
jgi:hypothetical protein